MTGGAWRYITTVHPAIDYIRTPPPASIPLAHQVSPLPHLYPRLRLSVCIFRMSYAPGYPQPGYPGAGAHQPHHSQSFPQPPHGSPAPHGYPGAPPPQHAPQPQGASNIPTTGQAEGAQFRIDHRDSNSMLYLRLQPGYEIKAKPGSMVAMDASVQIKGKLKFSFKKIFTGGEVCAPPFLRDCLLPMNRWRARHDV